MQTFFFERHIGSVECVTCHLPWRKSGGGGGFGGEVMVLDDTLAAVGARREICTGRGHSEVAKAPRLIVGVGGSAMVGAGGSGGSGSSDSCGSCGSCGSSGRVDETVPGAGRRAQG